MAQADIDYLNRTWPGGAEAYINSQQNRLQEAAKAGDTGLIDRLIADASRVGYSILPDIVSQASKAPSEVLMGGYVPAVSGGGLTLVNQGLPYPSEMLQSLTDAIKSAGGAVAPVVSGAAQSAGQAVGSVLDFKVSDSTKNALMIAAGLIGLSLIIRLFGR